MTTVGWNTSALKVYYATNRICTSCCTCKCMQSTATYQCSACRTVKYKFNYDNGSHAPIVGETIHIDGEAGATADISGFTVNSGDWGTSDATGIIFLFDTTQLFLASLANNDVIKDAGGTTICLTTGGTSSSGIKSAQYLLATVSDVDSAVNGEYCIYHDGSVNDIRNSLWDCDDGPDGTGDKQMMYYANGGSVWLASADGFTVYFYQILHENCAMVFDENAQEYGGSVTITPVNSCAVWAVDTPYIVGQEVVKADKLCVYVCRQSHTSTTLDEPDVGASWGHLWE